MVTELNVVAIAFLPKTEALGRTFEGRSKMKDYLYAKARKRLLVQVSQVQVQIAHGFVKGPGSSFQIANNYLVALSHEHWNHFGANHSGSACDENLQATPTFLGLT